MNGSPDEEGIVLRSIFQLRGQAVMLDSDLAKLFGTTTSKLNQQVKRNIARFDEQFAFQMTESEFEDLKSQNVTSSSRHGGRRTPPWVFTEHGIPMLSTVLKTPRAVAMLKLVIGVFVDTRLQFNSGDMQPGSEYVNPEKLEWRQKLQDKLLKMASVIGDFQINKREKKSLQDEVEEITVSVIEAVKARLDQQAINNQVLLAEIQIKLAETERLKAEARRLHAEADSVDLKNLKDQYQYLSSIAADLAALDPAPLLSAMNQIKQNQVLAEDAELD